VRTVRILLAAWSVCLATPLLAAGELQVWIRASTESRRTYDAIAAAFKARTGVGIEYFNTITDFEQRLARAAAGSSLPDVVFDDAAYLGQFVSMGIVAEIDRAGLKGGADVVDRAWESARAADGRYYGVPTSAQAFALFIRKDWRAKLGLPLPRTWGDLEALARAFVERDPDGNGKRDTYGFVLPASTTRGYASWFLSSFVWQAGDDIVRAAPGGFKASLGKPTGEALAFMRSLICQKLTQPGAINATTADAIPAFRSGQAGIFFTGPYHFAVFDKEPGKDRYEVVAPPPGPKDATVLAEGTSGYVMKASSKKSTALAFIEFVISPEGQELGMTGAGGQPVVRLPVNRKVDVRKVYRDERWDLIQELYSKNGRYVPRVPNWQPIRQVTAEGFNRVLASCGSNIDQELAALSDKVNAELAKQQALAR